MSDQPTRAELQRDYERTVADALRWVELHRQSEPKKATTEFSPFKVFTRRQT